jgi:hypothetical protein
MQFFLSDLGVDMQFLQVNLSRTPVFSPAFLLFGGVDSAIHRM